jgi:hypothetical protein
MGTVQEAAAAKGDAGGCGCRTHFKKVTARRHGNFSPTFFAYCCFIAG